MNNLEMAMEAALGSPATQGGTVFDFGNFRAALFYPCHGDPGYHVGIADDPLEYDFPSFADAMDFICGEAKLK